MSISKARVLLQVYAPRVALVSENNPTTPSHWQKQSKFNLNFETRLDISLSTLPSHGLGSQSDPFIHSFEENDIMQEKEVITEVARISRGP